MIFMGKYKVSIFTCVYNRAHTIDRVFKSVRNQTYDNIEHVIVDDGSTDDLFNLVEEYKKSVPYEVIFIQKENGGKHTATNIAWDNSTGDFIIQLDSDDELLPEAISFLVNTYENIPDEIKDEYWCVQARCMDQNGKKIGEDYPDNINTMEVERAKKIARKTSGGKIGLMKSEKLLKYRYPTPKYVTFVAENYLWYPLNLQYRTWYTNTVVHIYFLDTVNSISKSVKTPQLFSNWSYIHKYYLENRKNYNMSLKEIGMYLLRYSIFYTLSTNEYKNEYTIYLKKEKLLNIVLVVLKIPSVILKKILLIKWKTKTEGLVNYDYKKSE